MNLLEILEKGFSIARKCIEILLGGGMVIICSIILKKDVREMSEFQCLCSVIFLGLTVAFLKKNWVEK